MFCNVGDLKTKSNLEMSTRACRTSWVQPTSWSGTFQRDSTWPGETVERPGASRDQAGYTALSPWGGWLNGNWSMVYWFCWHLDWLLYWLVDVFRDLLINRRKKAETECNQMVVLISSWHCICNLPLKVF